MKHSLTICDVIDSLIAVRKAKKMTQTAVANRLGLPQSYISRIESGRLDLRLSSLIDIARFLNLEVMLIPTNMITTVESLISFDPRKRRDGPLYELGEMDEDESS